LNSNPLLAREKIMAKPLTLITELSDSDAKIFIKEQENPTPNPAAEKLVAEARKLKIDFSKL